ncbi:TRAP transporter large permease subunit [Paracoccus hibiscisoli]|uniref:TRAP transporter large permease subunit n=1 Tax=Paracoccus hibiscisoli TaxID=2023261 RepID=A0A4U0RBL7_9RHOB|nr:TRAP transporter large permease subunit [Paracoccus hibiscisoli]TJZ85574.1 TRAP transporter large permease subunit [Paracoccus hibiscisoli]
MTGATMLILASLSFRISFTGMPATATAFIDAISEGPVMVMLILNLLLLVVGCVMDMGPANLFFIPILPPIAQKAGYVPVHFGSMMIFNLAMGTIIPPVGPGLFVGASVTRVKVGTVMVLPAPCYLMVLALLLVITHLPWLNVWPLRALATVFINRPARGNADIN